MREDIDRFIKQVKNEVDPSITHRVYGNINPDTDEMRTVLTFMFGDIIISNIILQQQFFCELRNRELVFQKYLLPMKRKTGMLKRPNSTEQRREMNTIANMASINEQKRDYSKVGK